MHFLQVVKENGFKYFLPIPNRLKERIHVKNYLLIQPTVDGSDDPAEIVRVIDSPYKRFYEANNVWPVKFNDPDLGDQGLVQKKPVQTSRERKQVKKKPPKPKPIIKPPYEPTDKLTYEKMKKEGKLGKDSETESSETESETDDDEETLAKKRRRRVSKLGESVIEPGNDNTTVTSAVITERPPIVKRRDELPRYIGEGQPWSAILQRKHMTEKQIQKHIQKEIRNKLKKTKMLVRMGVNPEDFDLPCGVVQGQILTPWEDLVGKYKNIKGDTDTDDTDDCD